MRTKACKNRNYTLKGKTTHSKGQKDDKKADNENKNDSEAQPTLQNAAYHTTNTVLIQGNKKQMWVNKEHPILKNVLKRMKEKDLTILDAYNQVLDLTSKDDHYYTTMSIPISEKNLKNIQPNQVPTAIPPIVITLPELDKTEQEVVLGKTIPAKVSEKTPQTNEVEIKHEAIGHKDTALMEMDDMSRKRHQRQNQRQNSTKISKQTEKYH